MVGLHYLKHMYEQSDESVVERFVENLYWQYFCGFEFFQHSFPCDPTSLVRWRKRVGPDGIEKLLKQTLETAKREQVLKVQECVLPSSLVATCRNTARPGSAPMESRN